MENNASYDLQRDINMAMEARETFVKADAGKARYDLLPPEFLSETSAVLTYGAKKYTPNNWANGADWSRYFSAMQRHLWAWWGGEDKDAETGITHLAHAACCLAFLMAYENRKIGRDDRQKVEVNNAN